MAGTHVTLSAIVAIKILHVVPAAGSKRRSDSFKKRGSQLSCAPGTRSKSTTSASSVSVLPRDGTTRRRHAQAGLRRRDA